MSTPPRPPRVVLATPALPHAFFRVAYLIPEVTTAAKGHDDSD